MPRGRRVEAHVSCSLTQLCDKSDLKRFMNVYQAQPPVKKVVAHANQSRRMAPQSSYNRCRLVSRPAVTASSPYTGQFDQFALREYSGIRQESSCD